MHPWKKAEEFRRIAPHKYARRAYGNDGTGCYNEYLGRAPTSTELAQYASQMTAGANDRTIEQEITNLPEYANNPPASPPSAGCFCAITYRKHRRHRNKPRWQARAKRCSPSSMNIHRLIRRTCRW